MPKTRPPYPVEFRQQMIELVRSGRTPRSLAQEFGYTAQSIANWVAQANGGEDGAERSLTSTERKELAYLRRENRTLRQERDILAKATAWFANKGE